MPANEINKRQQHTEQRVASGKRHTPAHRHLTQQQQQNAKSQTFDRYFSRIWFIAKITKFTSHSTKALSASSAEPPHLSFWRAHIIESQRNGTDGMCALHIWLIVNKKHTRASPPPPPIPPGSCHMNFSARHHARSMCRAVGGGKKEVDGKNPSYQQNSI